MRRREFLGPIDCAKYAKYAEYTECVCDSRGHLNREDHSG
jgi:hypothetical protein